MNHNLILNLKYILERQPMSKFNVGSLTEKQALELLRKLTEVAKKEEAKLVRQSYLDHPSRHRSTAVNFHFNACSNRAVQSIMNM